MNIAIVGTGYVGLMSHTIKIKKNNCGLAKSHYICGGGYPTSDGCKSI